MTPIQIALIVIMVYAIWGIYLVLSIKIKIETFEYSMTLAKRDRYYGRDKK